MAINVDGLIQTAIVLGTLALGMFIGFVLRDINEARKVENDKQKGIKQTNMTWRLALLSYKLGVQDGKRGK